MEVREDISVPWNKTIVIVGARNQGKSNLAQFLVLNPEAEGNRGLGCQCDVILVFGNGASYLQWAWLQKPHKVYPQLEESAIKEAFRINELRLQRGKKPIRFLLVFDDSLSRETVHSSTINKVFTHGRHTHIVPMVLQQSISQVHSDWKRNADIFFLFRPRTMNDRNWVHENLLETEKAESLAMLLRIPKHTCLVVDYSDSETKTYQLKAPLISVE